MDIKDEIKFIKELNAVPRSIILDNITLFFDVLNILEESHQNGGVFEVTDDNLYIFNGFSNWIREINESLNLKRLESFASGFEGKFDT